MSFSRSPKKQQPLIPTLLALEQQHRRGRQGIVRGEVLEFPLHINLPRDLAPLCNAPFSLDWNISSSPLLGVTRRGGGACAAAAAATGPRRHLLGRAGAAALVTVVVPAAPPFPVPVPVAISTVPVPVPVPVTATVPIPIAVPVPVPVPIPLVPVPPPLLPVPPVPLPPIPLGPPPRVVPTSLVAVLLQAPDEAVRHRLDVHEVAKPSPSALPVVEIAAPRLPKVRHGTVLHLHLPSRVIPPVHHRQRVRRLLLVRELRVHVPDHVIAEVVAHVQRLEASELSQLLVHVLKEDQEILEGALAVHLLDSAGGSLGRGAELGLADGVAVDVLDEDGGAEGGAVVEAAAAVGVA
eukprot:CAMPEP_0183328042 /NCGR_PEP_ID=MMETSP0160_2-20130417/84078_1 /TAXON_ID=2839 ORGANISM="Odontella Sinensis, Strain Grunow 1884" /NCGR_SAMPLE_ID=MMETSP0160_2 /ASSEMBLY_ACC=CAM_ASM_000250 /LENGTH=350 /DNA_ID=CAMNT_0025496195 /DNA_START=228 /DNA_END=1277 /DNA_ORIENTATION=+